MNCVGCTSSSCWLQGRVPKTKWLEVRETGTVCGWSWERVTDRAGLPVGDGVGLHWLSPGCQVSGVGMPGDGGVGNVSPEYFRHLDKGNLNWCQTFAPTGFIAWLNWGSCCHWCGWDSWITPDVGHIVMFVPSSVWFQKMKVIECWWVERWAIYQFWWITELLQKPI